MLTDVTRGRKRGTVAVLVWLATAGVVSGQQGAFKAGPYIQETPHYRIVTDISKEKALEIAKHMESIFRSYSIRLSAFGGNVTSRYEVRVYRDQESYIEEVGERFRDTGGVYVSGRRALLTFKGRKPWGRVFSILYHEGFHQFFHNYIGRGPPWVNEGLATLFEGSAWNGKGFDVGDVQPGRLWQLQDAFRSGSYMRLRDLATTDMRSWISNLSAGEDNPARLQYSFSWSLVHFLAYGNRGRYKKHLDQYLWALKNRTDYVQAFLGAFGGNLDGIERAWIKYVMKLKPTPRQVCRNNLLMLALIEKACALGMREEQPDIQAFYDAVTSKKWKGWWVQGPDGKRYSFEDTDAIKKWFRCPFDKSRKRKISYKFERLPESGHLPTIVCRHHRGIVYRANLVQEGPKGRMRAWVETEIREKRRRRRR